MLDLPGEQEVSVEPRSLVVPSEEAHAAPEPHPDDGYREPMLAENEETEETQEPTSLPIQGEDGSRLPLSSPRRPA
jgi:hypothetical protein